MQCTRHKASSVVSQSKVETPQTAQGVRQEVEEDSSQVHLSGSLAVAVAVLLPPPAEQEQPHEIHHQPRPAHHQHQLGLVNLQTFLYGMEGCQRFTVTSD